MSTPETAKSIETLLAERSRFETWLAQLAVKAATMPSHVVERVRADYQSRLDVVLGDLRARADGLREQAAALDARIASLDGDLRGCRDARAEDELRALVGEYDEAAWQARAAEHDGQISALETERATAEQDRARVREMLDEAVRPPRPATPDGEMDAVQAAPSHEDASHPDRPSQAIRAIVAEESLGAAAVGAETSASDASGTPSVPPSADAPGPPEPPHEAPPRRTSPFDEITFLRTVVGTVTPPPLDLSAPPAAPDGPGVPPSAPLAPASAAAPPSASRPTPPFVAPPRPVTPPVATPRSPTPPQPPAPLVPPPGGGRRSERTIVPSFQPPPIPDISVAPPPRPSVPPDAALMDFGAAIAEPPPSGSANGPFSGGFGGGSNTPTDSRVSASAQDASRSLKCQECGWMNYPTEWYCEKCGGELAAF